VALAAAATVAVALGSGPALARRTTEQLEYEWYRRTFPAAAPECRLAHVERAGRRVVAIPDYLRRERASVVGDGERVAATVRDGCALFVRTSICATAEGRRRCADAVASAHVTVVASTRLPARPSYDGFEYDGRVVEIALLRVTAPRAVP
jgi:hypothetical protein